MNSQSHARSRRRRIVWAPLVIAALIALFQYMRSERFVNPETGRAARLALSEEQEASLGLQSYREVLATSAVIESGPEEELVASVARRLAAVTGDAARKFDWRVSLVRDDRANAFCLPGGKIVVFTGILPVTRTEAGLAAVMGHEMAHATSRHGSQRMLQGQLANTLTQGAQASLMLGDMDPQQKLMVMAAIGAGAKYGVLLPFSRDHETEADAIGILYMARAGYDPREAIAFWERMSDNSRGQPPEFLSTHPSHGTRIERLKAIMPEAMKEYEAAKR